MLAGADWQDDEASDGRLALQLALLTSARYATAGQRRLCCCFMDGDPTGSPTELIEYLQVARQNDQQRPLQKAHPMDDLRRMQVFAAVVQHGSMSGAARALRLTPSAVSQQVKELERRAGVTLLLRTTRSLKLTETGRRFHEACAAMVSAAQRARAELESARIEPIGELRLSAPVGFARHLQPALCELMRLHPSLSQSQFLDDQPSNLVASRIDLGIAFGTLPDSDWSARRMGSFEFWLCAAPAYLERRLPPQVPEELALHDWLCFGGDSAQRMLNLSHRDGRTASVAVVPRLAANVQPALESACFAGVGIAAMSSLDVAKQVASGQLVRLLPDWT